MIELESMRFRNFGSYGDYWTEIPLKNMGPCLITGEILDNPGEEEEEDERVNDESPKSNGSGKSTIPNAILWGLFGRTSHVARPGNKIVNWFTGDDCIVELPLIGGDKITRMLTRDGKHELMFTKNGQEEKYISDTLATTKLHQAKLNRAFNLDWDIFCGSVFFNQYSRGWLEMTDNVRKQAMERMLRIDRFSIYADVAREKMVKLDAERAAKRKRLNDVLHNIADLDQQLTDLQTSLDSFETQRTNRKEQTIQLARTALSRRNTVELPDLAALQHKWAIVQQVEDKIQIMDHDVRRQDRLTESAQDELRRKRRDQQEIQTKIDNWKRKTGKQCPTCEQPVPDTHICDKIEPLQQESDQLAGVINKLLANLEKLKTNVAELREKKTSTQDKLAKVRPAITVDQAESQQREWKMFDSEARRAAERAQQIEAEENPHGPALERTRTKKTKVEQEQKDLEADIKNLDALYPHAAYINRAYADRRKIKSYVFQNHIPTLNSRLEHYLNVFNLDIALEFNESLGVNSDKWGYDFFCGGERKRADISLMMAAFDLHESIYGRQCNVVVLDEVDGRLDASGIDSLVQIIRNELASRVETVLIISHRSTLHSMFPRHIEVKRSDRFSYIEELR